MLNRRLKNFRVEFISFYSVNKLMTRLSREFATLPIQANIANEYPRNGFESGTLSSDFDNVRIYHPMHAIIAAM